LQIVLLQSLRHNRSGALRFWGGKCVQGPRHSCLWLGENFRRSPVNEFKAAPQAGLVCYLDLKAWTGIEFEKQGASLPINHHIYSEIAKPCHVKRPRCHVKHLFPIGHLDITQRMTRIRVMRDDHGTMNSSRCRPFLDVNPNAYCTSMEIGLPIRGAGW